MPLCGTTRARGSSTKVSRRSGRKRRRGVTPSVKNSTSIAGTTFAAQETSVAATARGTSVTLVPTNLRHSSLLKVCLTPMAATSLRPTSKVRRQASRYAKRKTGRPLTGSAGACRLAIGRPTFTSRPATITEVTSGLGGACRTRMIFIINTIGIIIIILAILQATS